MEAPLLSILIPVYNERQRVLKAIQSVQDAGLPWPCELIVVDDGSTDGTTDLLRQAAPARKDMRFFPQPRNRGKGAALRVAIKEARGRFCIIQDADLEYSPRDIPLLMAPLLEENADVVYGSRFWGWQRRRVLLFWHAVGNRFITLLVNMFSDLNLTDVETGYKAFRTSILQGMRLSSDGFEFEIEVTIKAARLGCVFYEVPISYRGRTYAEGKKITWKDGFKAIAAGIRHGLFSSTPRHSK